MKVIEWTYKDSSRYYWAVISRETSEVSILNDPDHFDTIWEFTIIRDGVIMFSGELVIQLDSLPTIVEILREYSAYITCVCMGFSAYGETKTSEEK